MHTVCKLHLEGAREYRLLFVESKDITCALCTQVNLKTGTNNYHKQLGTDPKGLCCSGKPDQSARLYGPCGCPYGNRHPDQTKVRGVAQWSRGLSRTCLHKQSEQALPCAMHEIRSCAQKMGLKPSISQYRQWGGKGAKRPLRFSKSGNPGIEKWYATHFVDEKRVAALKAQQQKAPEGE